MHFRPSIVVLLMWSAIVMAIEPDPLFSRGAVLVRGRPVAIHGTQAQPGETVTVRFADHQAQANAEADGRWRVLLPALAAGGPCELAITAPSGSITVPDVLVGDLWLCSGQSNMGLAMKDSAELAEAVSMPADDRLRMFSIPLGRRSEPQSTFAGKARWRCSSPTTLPGCSAVAWQFGRHLRRQLDVPVGLVVATWGGTRAQCWTPRTALQADFPQEVLRFDEALAKQATKPGKGYEAPLGHSNTPTDIYNQVIHPLTPGMITGVLWYQGEQDAGMGMRYRDALTTLVRGWRDAFRQPDLPFLIIQLPGFGGQYCAGFPGVRAAQAAAVGSIPHTALVVTVDTGDAHDIHPKAKEEVGRRAALAAAGFVHGRPLHWQAPLAITARREVDGTVRVRFDPVSLGGQSLVSLDGQDLRAFEVAGTTGPFIPTMAVLAPTAPDTVVVRVPEGVRPMRVRYAAAPWPGANLGTADRLAAVPFVLPVQEH